MTTNILLDYDAPGFYGELLTGTRPVSDPRPGAVAFVGYTLKGPIAPTVVTSISDYESKFGGPTPGSKMYDSVDMAFALGATRIFIQRIAAADAVAASLKIDESGGDQKYTATYLDPGVKANSSQLLIRGNERFLDLSATPEAYTKYDVLLLEIDDNSGELSVAASVEAVQFTNTTADDYWLTRLADPASGFEDLITVVASLGGLPSALASSVVEDETYATTQAFSEALDNAPILRNSLRLVAGQTATENEAQTPTPAIDGSEDGFNFTLPGGDILDDTLLVFFQKALITRESPTVTGTIDSSNTSFTIAAGGIANPVHREGTNFKLQYADALEASANLDTIGGSPATQDLAAVSNPIGGPVHPGTLTITVTIGASSETITDDGAGNLVGAVALPSGGTINYDTGVMTGVTATLDASTNVAYVYAIPKTITKASSTDNVATGVVLSGDGSGTIDLVNSATNPTQNGAVTITTSSAPLTGTTFRISYHPLGVVVDDADGVLTGDIGTATATFTNTVDPTDGSVSVIFDEAPVSGSTIDATYQSGLVITDDGEGNLIGDVLSSAANTVNYETGALSGSWSAAPVGTPLANYTHLPREATYNFASGADGSAIARTDITHPDLESSKGGIYALDGVLEPLIVTLPDFNGVSAVQLDVLDTFLSASSGRRLTRFYIGSVGSGKTLRGAANYLDFSMTQPDNPFAAFYHRDVWFRDRNGIGKLLPAASFMAAITSRVVGNTPGEAPANSNSYATTRRVYALEALPGRRRSEVPTTDEYAILARARVNPIRQDLLTQGFATAYDALTLSRVNEVYNTIDIPLVGQYMLWRTILALRPFVLRRLSEGIYRNVYDTLDGLFEGFDFLNDYQIICSRAENNPDSVKSRGLLVVDINTYHDELARAVPIRITQAFASSVSGS